MRTITGTFTTTGASAVVKTDKASISLVFAGVATVQVQRSLDGEVTWDTVGEYTEDDATGIEYDAAETASVRLNCSAHTADVSYVIRSAKPIPIRDRTLS